MEILTIRQRMFILLQQERLGARDISQALSLPEKEVYSHLAHISKSARRQGFRLEIGPGASCLACGFIFKARQRFAPPGRCPSCRDTHLTEPLFHLAPI